MPRLNSRPRLTQMVTQRAASGTATTWTLRLNTPRSSASRVPIMTKKPIQNERGTCRVDSTETSAPGVDGPQRHAAASMVMSGLASYVVPRVATKATVLTEHDPRGTRRDPAEEIG